MPTDLERTGDFSKSLNRAGGLRTIYDPDDDGFERSDEHGDARSVPRQHDPASRIDPTAKRIMQDFWGPNNAGDDLSGSNNFKASYRLADEECELLQPHRLEHQRQAEGVRPLFAIQDHAGPGQLHAQPLARSAER